MKKKRPRPRTAPSLRADPELEKWYAREMSTLHKAYQDGNAGALRDALEYCSMRSKDRAGNRKHRPHDAVDVPSWVLEAMLDEHTEALSLAWTKTRKKKSCRPRLTQVERWARDMKDFDRFNMVKELMEHGFTTSGSKKRRSVFKEAVDRVRAYDQDATPNSIKESYYRVRKAFKTKDRVGRYFFTRFQLLYTLRTTGRGPHKVVIEKGRYDSPPKNLRCFELTTPPEKRTPFRASFRDIFIETIKPRLL